MPGNRKLPFSTKQKKKQLQIKRERQRGKDKLVDEDGMPIFGRRDKSNNLNTNVNLNEDIKKINQQPVIQDSSNYDPNRYRLHFRQDLDEESKERKKQSRLPFKILNDDALVLDADAYFKPGSVLDMPKKPYWNYAMSKQELEKREEIYFKKYVDDIFNSYDAKELSYMELNLETWRQLWRVLTMSDVILIIVDIRHPVFHFSPVLYNYVTDELKKHAILVLNKIDLIPASLVIAWKHYFEKKYPLLKIICFTSFPKDGNNLRNIKLLSRVKQKKKHFAVGATDLLKICEEIVQDKVDLSSWKSRIELQANFDDSEEAAEVRTEEEAENNTDCYSSGILTIGCCGYPNVGKSSLMNGLVGKKVVSVSKTPGHTKHFQTIYLTNTVKLCDCPGLVFPSLIPKPFQILSGIYPISQVREPYSAVQFLAERINLPEILQISHPIKNGMPWSAWDICEMWALKRGYLTAKAARPDTYRAANHLLRLTIEGKLCLAFRPREFQENKLFWENHNETKSLIERQIAHVNLSTNLISNINNDEINESTSEDDDYSGDNIDYDDDDDETDHVGVSNPFDLLGDN